MKRREHYRYDYKNKINYLITTTLFFVASLVALSIFYYNAQKINEINLWIIKLGGVLILLSLFFTIKFGWRLGKEIINLLKRQKNWLKYLIIILIILLLWQSYVHKDTLFNPVLKVYNKTNFSLFLPISFGNLTLESNSNNQSEGSNTNKGIFNDIGTFFTGPKIDDTWVHNFISIINNDRAHPLKESNMLNSIAEKRFNKMMENPYISHYGADVYNVGEVIFYPEGNTEQAFAEDIQQTAPLHWDLLMDSSLSIYGYHIEEGPNIVIVGSCSTTEIPGPNIDVEEFFRQRGCTTERQNSLWLVIDMS